MHQARRDDPITRRLVFLGKELSKRFEAMLAAEGCTIPTWAVLRYASENPDLSQVRLAAHIGIEGPTLTRHLDKLCAEGLVCRTRDESDRRIIRVNLTPQGQARWEQLRGLAVDLETRYTRSLTPRQVAALDEAIVSLTAAIDAEDMEAMDALTDTRN